MKTILTHNRDEEKEHASMLIEWIRSKDSTFSKELQEELTVTEEYRKELEETD